MKKGEVNLKEACRLIKQGGVVAIPTETVYGLAGSAVNQTALRKIFKIKHRPLFNPLIVHCASATQMKEFHTASHPVLTRLISHFCPGPLTFVLNKTKKVHSLVTAHHQKVALRIPQHPMTLKLIQETGLALCAPSANRSGKLSPVTAEQVQSVFKGQVPVLNGGACTVGIESTVVEPDFHNHILYVLRPGMISKTHLREWLKKDSASQGERGASQNKTQKPLKWTVRDKSSGASPGQTSHHYRPDVPLIRVQLTPQDLGDHIKLKEHLKKKFPDKKLKELKLKSTAELSARFLYRDLHNLSQNPGNIIYVILKPGQQTQEAWLAIGNRLQKASSHTLYWPAPKKPH